MNAPAAPSHLTTAEVAALFRVHSHVAAGWARSGKLTAIRTPGGRDYRYDASQPLIAQALAYRDGGRP